MTITLRLHNWLAGRQTQGQISKGGVYIGICHTFRKESDGCVLDVEVKPTQTDADLCLRLRTAAGGLRRGLFSFDVTTSVPAEHTA